MRKNEQRLWDSFKRNAPARLWLQRVENLVGEGMPDVYVGSSGKWVELKAASKIPARARTPLLGADGMRPSQVAWHARAAETSAATRSYILIRTPEMELLMIPGREAGVVNLMSLGELRERSVIKADPSWEAVVEKLSC